MPVHNKHQLKTYNIDNYDRHFATYPDKSRYQRFRNGLIYGFRIGTAIPISPQLINPNPKYSIKDLCGIGEQIIKWRKAHFILGPIPWNTARKMRVTLNMLFGVPKPDGSTRPILNLSDKSKRTHSVNEKLQPELCTVEYVQQKELIHTVKALGKGAYLWAKDLQWGYNNVSMHKDDIKHLGFTFQNKIYLYQVLPMGLSSAPKIFTEFMHFPIWAMKHDDPSLYYINVPKDSINMSHFSKEADIQFCVESQQYKIAILTYYLDDILGGHPTKAGLYFHDKYDFKLK